MRRAEEYDGYLPSIGRYSIGDRVDYLSPRFSGEKISRWVETHGYIFLCNDVHGGGVVMRHWVPEENKYYPCYCPTIKDDESQEKWRRTKCSDLTQEQKAQQEACLLSAAEWYESNYHRPYPFNYLIGREVSAHFIEPPAQPPPIEQYEQMRLF